MRFDISLSRATNGSFIMKTGVVKGEIDTAEIYRVRKLMPAPEDRFLSV